MVGNVGEKEEATEKPLPVPFSDTALANFLLPRSTPPYQQRLHSQPEKGMLGDAGRCCMSLTGQQETVMALNV